MGNDRLSSLAVGDSPWSQSMGVQVMALGLLDTCSTTNVSCLGSMNNSCSSDHCLVENQHIKLSTR